MAPAWPPPPSGSQAPGWSRWGTPAPGGGEVCEYANLPQLSLPGYLAGHAGEHQHLGEGREGMGESTDEEKIFTLMTFQSMYMYMYIHVCTCKVS